MRIGVERAQYLLVRLHAQGAKEHRTVELTLTINADIQKILVVVFEFNPTAAIRNDLAQVIALRRYLFEEHAG